MWFFGKRKPEEVIPPEEPQKQIIERKVPELHTLCLKEQGNREYQQDAAFATPSKILAANRKTRVLGIICDGMGGMTDGGRASGTALKMMKEAFAQVEKVPELNIPAFFEHMIRRMDQVVSSFPKENKHGSGTTMVACIVEDNKLYWASVGDSRLYIIRGNEMRQMTRDHNFWLRLQEMVAAGQMSMQDAMKMKQKEALISFLGIGNVSLMDINTTPFELQYGDIVMLCSDGITKTLSDGQIKNILINNTVKQEQKAKALVEAATHGNTRSQDNTSVILITYQERNLKK